MAKLNPERDNQFESFARIVQPQRRTFRERLKDALARGLKGPDAIRAAKEADEYEDTFYLLDYSRGYGPGMAYDYDGAEFVLPLADLGDGQVDTRLLRGIGNTGTFTRATVATCRLASGLLKKVASGVPRSHYLADGSYGGYLAEGARTNLCPQSEDLATTWTNSRSTETVNAIAAPDGTTTADKVTEDATATNTHGVSQAFTYTAAVHTFSFFAKAGERSWVRCNLFDGTTSRGCYFDVSNGVVGTASGGTGSIEAWRDGWYRCVFTTDAAVAAALGNFFMQLASGDGGQIYSGDGASGAYFWGAQLEAAAFASSYIPTTTASVTRNADVLTYPASGNVNASEGTLYVESVPLSSDDGGATFLRHLSLNDAVSDELYVGRNFGAARGFVTDGGVSQCSFSGGAFAQNSLGKAAMRYKLNDVNYAFNGVSATVDSSATMPTPTTISIGTGLGTAQAFSAIKNVRIWQRQLTDAVLQALTA